MDRRTFLQAAGAAGIVGAAGCLDGGDSESPSTTPNDEAVSDDSYEAVKQMDTTLILIQLN